MESIKNEFEVEQKNELELSLLDIFTEYFSKVNFIKEFHIQSLTLSSIFLNLRLELINNGLEKVLSEKLCKRIEEMNELMKIKDKPGKDYEIKIDEKIIIDYYHAFEEYLYDIIYALYCAFPRFLKDDKELVLISYESVFRNNNILYCREIIIERKTKDLIQANNIIELIKKIKNIFGIVIELDKELLNQVYKYSKYRNILIHNNGIANTILLNDLKRYGIATNLERGQTVLDDINSSDCNDCLFNMASNINNTISSRLEQIKIYHSKK